MASGKLDFNELSRIARAATDDVVEDARRRGERLAVWQGSKVVHVAPEDLGAREAPQECGDDWHHAAAAASLKTLCDT